MTLLYPSEKILVAPVPMLRNASESYQLGLASKACALQGDDLRVPSIEEMISLAINYKLIDEDFVDGAMTKAYATSTNADDKAGGASQAWVHRAFGIGIMNFAVRPKTDSFAVRCIRR